MVLWNGGKMVVIPYNPYLAHCALSKLEFPIGNIYCIIPKERTPQPLQLSIMIIRIFHEVGREWKALLFIVIWKQIDTKVLSKQQNFFDAFIQELEIVMSFFLKKWGVR